MKTLTYLNEQLELLKEIQYRYQSSQVKEDIERVKECIEEVKALQIRCFTYCDEYFKLFFSIKDNK